MNELPPEPRVPFREALYTVCSTHPRLTLLWEEWAHQASLDSPTEADLQNLIRAARDHRLLEVLNRTVEGQATQMPILNDLAQMLAGAWIALSGSSQSDPFEYIKDNRLLAPAESFNTHMRRMEACVCLIEIPKGKPRGTGFLVGPSVVMTCYHVLGRIWSKENSPSELVVRFDVGQHNERDTPKRSYYLVQDGWEIDSSPPSPADEETAGGRSPNPNELDYIVLRLDGQPGSDLLEVTGDGQKVERKWIEIPEQPHNFALEQGLHILQHAEGKELRSYYNNGAEVTFNANKTRITYKVGDMGTTNGSSGSPCFNNQVALVAIHHARERAKPPTYNQGVPIAAIRFLLHERHKLTLLTRPSRRAPELRKIRVVDYLRHNGFQLGQNRHKEDDDLFKGHASHEDQERPALFVSSVRISSGPGGVGVESTVRELLEQRSLILFAKEGYGKTSCLREVYRRTEADSIAITLFFPDLFPPDAPINITSYLTPILQKIRETVEKHYEHVTPPDNFEEVIQFLDALRPAFTGFREALVKLADKLYTIGIKNTSLLFDGLDDIIKDHTLSIEYIQRILTPLFFPASHFDIPGVTFKFFLPHELEQPMQQWFRRSMDRLQVYRLLRWSDESLLEVLQYRIMVGRFGLDGGANQQGNLPDFLRFSSLCDPSSAYDADERLVEATQDMDGSPRRLLRLAGTVIEIHCSKLSTQLASANIADTEETYEKLIGTLISETTMAEAIDATKEKYRSLSIRLQK